MADRRSIDSTPHPRQSDAHACKVLTGSQHEPADSGRLDTQLQVHGTATERGSSPSLNRLLYTTGISLHLSHRSDTAVFGRWQVTLPIEAVTPYHKAGIDVWSLDKRPQEHIKGHTPLEPHAPTSSLDQPSTMAPAGLSSTVRVVVFGQYRRWELSLTLFF